MNYLRVSIAVLFVTVLFLFSVTNTFAGCSGALQCYDTDPWGGCLSTHYTDSCSGANESACLNSAQCGPCGQAGGADCSWTSSCIPGATTCGACSVSCGGGTQTCENGCSTWNRACNTQDCCTPVATTCGACSVSCGGGTKSCTNGCNTWPESCNTQNCCAQVAPDAPTTTEPADGQILAPKPTVNFAWTAPASWGEGCSNALSYHLCVSDTNGGACNRYDLGGISSAALSNSGFVPDHQGVHWWRLAAVNNGQETWSAWKSFSAQVDPNCSNLTGPTEINVGASSNFTADFSTPGVDSDLGAQIFFVRSDGGWTGLSMQGVTTNPQNITGTWVPTAGDVGAKTLYCRAWNDGKSECRPPTLVDGWPRVACAGPNYSFNTCVEGFNSTSPSYVSAWTAWPTVPTYCGNVTRTRTCSETCGTDDCSAYFASKVGCDVAANCSYVGNTQTETRFNVCCSATYPDTPALMSPANGAEITYGTNATMDWSDVASWGIACPTNDNHYNVCVSTVSGICNLEDSRTDLDSFATRPAIIIGNIYWSATANNGSLERQSVIRSVCVEGFNTADTSYVSAWSACDASHKRTRTCIEDCGTNNCAGVITSEDCLGTVRGTLFDGSDYSSCPAFDPATGYLTGLPAGVGAPSRSFGFSGPWAPLSGTSTDVNGNYSISAYAPGDYSYDFSALNDIYSTVETPKLTCVSAVASVPGSDPSCITQPCSILNNMSFGFWRSYGGWWQAVGGSVHGEDGIRSIIPASLPTEQSLILPEGNKWGVLSYGIPRPANMLGTNPDAQVSSKKWEKQSSYDGLIYDWGFYNTRFNLFEVTNWNGVTPVTYADGGLGYQIFSKDTTGLVDNFNLDPVTSGQKMIFMVNGDVRVTGNIIVADGGFLAVIAKGTITFDPSITSADGWYVGNVISVPCHDVGGDGCDKDDSQFLGNGSFIGWSNIALSRDGGINNNSYPPEKFTYRQDLFNNAPDPMKVYSKIYKPFVP